jgi:hypothetical protein
MNSSNHIGQKLSISPKAFRQGSKTKKWQIEAKPTWHRFWRENQLVQTKKSAKRRAPDLENQESGYKDQGTVQPKDSTCFK